MLKLFYHISKKVYTIFAGFLKRPAGFFVFPRKKELFMKKYLDEIVRSLQKIIGFDSALAAPEEGMPFGKGAAQCLQAFLSLAEGMGFETRNYDNYAGEVLFGEGEEFAILCHLDVVPAGDGWTHPPFGGDIEDGRLYGRGAMDDKGPAVICLYCLKALKDSGFAPRKKIKLIVGCNEESGWACIEHYKQCAHMPDTGFSPDADFPVIYAEKGILHFCAAFPIAGAPFAKLRGGERTNMVCAYAAAEGVRDTEGFAAFGLTCEGQTLAAHGTAAHASTPDEGDNALQKLLAFFARQNADVKRAYDILFADILGLKALHDETGALTMSPDVADYQDGILYVTTDIRYPATMRQTDVTDRLDKAGVRYELLHCQPPLYNDKNGSLVRTLLAVYEEATGEKAEPIAIGGGTYARALKNGAGFGPQFADEPATIHCADEYITLENIEKLAKIYRLAIERLTR